MGERMERGDGQTVVGGGKGAKESHIIGALAW